MQSLWLIVVVFFLILLILPIIIKIHFSYDVLNNLGTMSLYLFFIKLFAYKFKFKNKNIILISKKNKEEIETEISNKQMRFLEQLLIQLKQKVVIKKLHAYSRIGLLDAGLSAILSGLFNVIVSSFYARIKNIKKSANIGVFAEPSYNEKHCIFSIFGKCSITLFDILYSLVMSATIIKRREKYERV